MFKGLRKVNTSIWRLRNLNRKPFRVYVTGVPGTGKTEFARKLAKKLKGIHLNLGKLCLDKKLTLGFDEERACMIADLEKLRKHLYAKFRESRKPLIFEAPFTLKLRKPLTPSKIFVLRCEPKILADRLKDKGYSPKKIMENIWAEILDYCLHEALASYSPRKIHEIDTSYKNVKEAVEEAIKVLSGKIKPSWGKTLWLKKLEEEGNLEKISVENEDLALKRLTEG
jgi:adenylate kinase